MGTVEQTPAEAATKTGCGEKEGQGKGVAWETVTQRHTDRARA